MNLNHSQFTPEGPTRDYSDPVVFDNGIGTQIRRSDLIREHVQAYNLSPLKCDYFGMDSYYYDKATKIMYKVCNVYDKYADKSIKPIFEVSTDEHILQINNLQK